jgi:hypothetical protein
MAKRIPIFLRITGYLLILIGMVAAFYGLLDIFVFYINSD